MDSFFKGYGITINDIIHVSPKETVELCTKGAVLVDVRENYMNRYKMFDVETLIFCPESLLKEKYKELPNDKPLIFVDATGIKSKKAVLMLTELGINKIANMAGGLVEWERHKLPLVIDKTEKLTGSCMCMLRPREKKREND